MEKFPREGGELIFRGSCPGQPFIDEVQECRHFFGWQEDCVVLRVVENPQGDILRSRGRHVAGRTGDAEAEV